MNLRQAKNIPHPHGTVVGRTHDEDPIAVAGGLVPGDRARRNSALQIALDLIEDAEALLRIGVAESAKIKLAAARIHLEDLLEGT